MSSKISTIMANKKPSQTKTKKVSAVKKTAPILESVVEEKNTAPIIETKPQIDNSVFWWSAEEESNQQPRGLLWYAGITILSIALVIFAIIQKNYLFLLFVILAAIVYYLMGRQTSRKHIFRINIQGVTVDEKTFPHDEIKGFGIFEKLNKEYLIFETSSFTQKYVLAPLKKDKERIVEFLKKHIPEKQYEENFLDTLEDFLKF
jgi:hypothetical protein